MAPGCLADYYGGLRVDGVPRYWVQRLIRPRDASAYLSAEEQVRPVTCSTTENSIPAVQNSLFSHVRIVPQNFAQPVGEVTDHPSETFGLHCSSSPASIVTSAHLRGVYFAQHERPAHYAEWMVNAVAEYNQSVPSGERIRVVSMSTSCDNFSNPAVAAAMERLQDEVTFVFAAENSGGPTNCHAGREMPRNLLYVTAMGAGPGTLASYSNYGDGVGGAVPMEWRATSVSGESFGGTSAAAPMLAGVLVTIHQVNPLLSASTARLVLELTSTEQGDRSRFGAGIPNLPLAVRVARSVRSSDSKAAIEALVAEVVAMALADWKERRFSPWGDSTAEHLAPSDHCSVFGEHLDSLLNHYLLTGRSEAVGRELCEIADANDDRIGRSYYCSLKWHLDRYGEDRLSSDPALYGRLIRDGEGLLGKERLLAAVLRARELHPEGAAASILVHPRFQALFPQQWESWIQFLLGTHHLPSRIQSALGEVLTENWSTSTLLWENFLGRFTARADLEMTSRLWMRRLLNRPQFWHDHAELARAILDRSISWFLGHWLVDMLRDPDLAVVIPAELAARVPSLQGTVTPGPREEVTAPSPTDPASAEFVVQMREFESKGDYFHLVERLIDPAFISAQPDVWNEWMERLVVDERWAGRVADAILPIRRVLESGNPRLETWIERSLETVSERYLVQNLMLSSALHRVFPGRALVWLNRFIERFGEDARLAILRSENPAFFRMYPNTWRNIFVSVATSSELTRGARLSLLRLLEVPDVAIRPDWQELRGLLGVGVPSVSEL